MTQSQPARRSGPGKPAAPPARPWNERLDDPDEALYTIAVAADLLGMGVQAVRRLGAAIDESSARPSGNQRRYSRTEITTLAAARDLSQQGYPPSAIGRILELEQQIHSLRLDR